MHNFDFENNEIICMVIENDPYFRGFPSICLHRPSYTPLTIYLSANYSHVPLGGFKVDIVSILFLGCEGTITCGIARGNNLEHIVLQKRCKSEAHCGKVYGGFVTTRFAFAFFIADLVPFFSSLWGKVKVIAFLKDMEISTKTETYK